MRAGQLDYGLFESESEGLAGLITSINCGFARFFGLPVKLPLPHFDLSQTRTSSGMHRLFSAQNRFDANALRKIARTVARGMVLADWV